MHLSNFEITLLTIDKLCTKNSVSYAIIGGIAGIIHKLSRTTQDIDITLLVDLEQIERIGKILLTKFTPIKNNPINFFKNYFVLPTRFEKTGIHVNFSAGLSQFDKIVIERSKRIKFGNINVSVCSAEDLIIYKLIAARTQDMADVEQLIEIHQENLDFKYLIEIAKGFIDLERGDILEYIKKNMK